MKNAVNWVLKVRFWWLVSFPATGYIWLCYVFVLPTSGFKLRDVEEFVLNATAKCKRLYSQS